MHCRTLIALCLLCCVSCLSCQPGDRDFIEKQIRRTMRKQHLPAMAVALVNDQDIVYLGASGLIDIENNIPASTQSVFKLWSLAKVFTAIEIFREIEEGMVELDAPLTTYLPDFRIQSRFAHNEAITIKEILAHRAGLPRHEGLMPAGLERDTNYIERFELGTWKTYRTYPVAYRYKYSNLGYDLLGRVIEETRDEGYFKHMKLNILNDLGMLNSAFYSGGIDSSLPRALGYEYHKRKYYPYFQYDINNFPSGNLYATIEDLSAFLQAVFKNDLFAEKETISRMFVDHYSKPGDPQPMGLGWKLARLGSSEPLIWHDGGPSEGIGSLIAFLPQRKIGIAVIGNGTGFSGYYSLTFAIEILTRLIEEESGINYPEPKKPKEIEVQPELLKELEGKYAAFGSIMDVRLKGKKLKASIGGMGLNLVPVNDREFAVTNWMDEIGLTRIIKPPVDISKIRINFMDKPWNDDFYMILNINNFSYEICPRYPVPLEVPESWKALEGSYERAELVPGNTIGEFYSGRMEIEIEDHVLSMSAPYGPVYPITDTSILVLSGSYMGEVMNYSPDSGIILHQKTAFLPLNE